jgi:ATP-dependent DNA ligase
MEAFRPAGVEGLVGKGAASRYAAGRGWIKYKSGETVEVIAGGVIGPLNKPEVLVAAFFELTAQFEQLLLAVGERLLDAADAVGWS